MTGAGGFTPSRERARTRWVGRAGILDRWPAAPQWLRLLCLSAGMFGLQITWSCEMAQGTPSFSYSPVGLLADPHLEASPYLLSLGLSKSMMSIVFVAGPLSGLIVQPLVGVLSDACKSPLGRRRPFMIVGCIVSSVAVLLLGWAAEVAAVVATTGGVAVRPCPSISLAPTITLTRLSSLTASAADHRSRHPRRLRHVCTSCLPHRPPGTPWAHHPQSQNRDFSINVVQAMDRSLLVDVVPPALQPAANAWASRMFGFGAVFGYWFGGLDLVHLTRGHLGKDQLKVLTFFTAFFLLVTHAITAGCVKERVLISREDEHGIQDGKNSTKRAILDIWTTFRTLPRPIQQVLNVQVRLSSLDSHLGPGH